MPLQEPTTAAEVRARYRAVCRRLTAQRRPSPPPRPVDDVPSSDWGAPMIGNIANTQAALVAISPRHIAVEIVGVVACHMDTTTRDLLSASRYHKHVLPRQIAMYVLHEWCGMPFKAIGRRLKRDHTTCLHGYRLIKARLEWDADLHAIVEQLRELLPQKEYPHAIAAE